nr:ribonuclease H-like domain-containing protein [Tanacetum cinerariifolium]
HDIGVATPRALVNAGLMTSGDARSRYMIKRDAKSWIDCFTCEGNDQHDFDACSQTLRHNGNPQQALKDKGVIDSGCSRHMTGNMSYLFDFEELNGGYVAFGGNPKGGKITGKGKIKTKKLDFDDVYFVKELKFNLFSVSQIISKKDKIGSKPDENGKRGEAGKSQKQLQWIKEEKLKKTQKERPNLQSPTKFIRRKKEQGLLLQFCERYKRGIKSATFK